MSFINSLMDFLFPKRKYPEKSIPAEKSVFNKPPADVLIEEKPLKMDTQPTLQEPKKDKPLQKINAKGIALLHSFESLRLEAYLPTAKDRYTIGWGNTFYENGRAVKKGDKITKERADELFANIVARFEVDVRSLLTVPVNDNQFSALVCFAYNVGSDIDPDDIPEGLGDSTLLKLVNFNPNNSKIRDEFMKWNKQRGQVVNGLTRRRKAEADLYFSL